MRPSRLRRAIVSDHVPRRAVLASIRSDEFLCWEPRPRPRGAGEGPPDVSAHARARAGRQKRGGPPRLRLHAQDGRALRARAQPSRGAARRRAGHAGQRRKIRRLPRHRKCERGASGFGPRSEGGVPERPSHAGASGAARERARRPRFRRRGGWRTRLCLGSPAGFPAFGTAARATRARPGSAPPRVRRRGRSAHHAVSQAGGRGVRARQRAGSHRPLDPGLPHRPLERGGEPPHRRRARVAGRSGAQDRPASHRGSDPVRKRRRRGRPQQVSRRPRRLRARRHGPRLSQPDRGGPCVRGERRARLRQRRRLRFHEARDRSAGASLVCAEDSGLGRGFTGDASSPGLEPAAPGVQKAARPEGKGRIDVRILLAAAAVLLVVVAGGTYWLLRGRPAARPATAGGPPPKGARRAGARRPSRTSSRKPRSFSTPERSTRRSPSSRSCPTRIRATTKRSFGSRR